MSDKLYDFATQKAAISGYFAKDYELTLQWLPQYVEEFPKAMDGVSLKWNKCKFILACESLVPDNHGVYCFSIDLGKLFQRMFIYHSILAKLLLVIYQKDLSLTLRNEKV
ncbi:MAG: hypothetical protein RMZ69_30330 [Nostoc sp. ChiQUE01a]|nr:hypothetical protein [Nostoc sp. ChiQUE01a]